MLHDERFPGESSYGSPTQMKHYLELGEYLAILTETQNNQGEWTEHSYWKVYPSNFPNPKTDMLQYGGASALCTINNTGVIIQLTDVESVLNAKQEKAAYWESKVKWAKGLATRIKEGNLLPPEFKVEQHSDRLDIQVSKVVSRALGYKNPNFSLKLGDDKWFEELLVVVKQHHPEFYGLRPKPIKRK